MSLHNKLEVFKNDLNIILTKTGNIDTTKLHILKYHPVMHSWQKEQSGFWLSISGNQDYYEEFKQLLLDNKFELVSEQITTNVLQTNEEEISDDYGEKLQESC